MDGGEAGFHDGAGKARVRQKSGLNCGKLGSQVQPHQLPIRCPECGSKRIWRDGLRYPRSDKDPPIQRWLCRDCGFRFSQSDKLKVKVNVASEVLEPSNTRKDNLNEMFPSGNFAIKQFPNGLPLSISENVGTHNLTITEKGLNILSHYNRERRVRVSEVEAKNLAEVESRTGERAAGATKKPTPEEVKGKIVEYAWWLKKNGYSQVTIEVRVNKLKRLCKLGANLLEPENVKETIAQSGWSVNTKVDVCAIYNNFLKFQGLSWNPPLYKMSQSTPFIPTEAELDTLIAAASKKLAALLQLLKETGMRIGEAVRLRWTDIDFERHIIRVQAEKNSNPRMFRVSQTLIDMLNRLPRSEMRIWNSNLRTLTTIFHRLRLRSANKLGNPRLKQITFHTFRHWKATMEYHKTKDILHVKELLGHKCLDSTLIYINVEKAVFGDEKGDEFHVRVAQTPEEIKELLETGFEYICVKDGLMFFRKRR